MQFAPLSPEKRNDTDYSTGEMTQASMPSWFQFLKIEAELALTYINSARLYRDPENVVRSLGNARVALAEIRRGLMNPDARGLSQNEVVFLTRRCTEIELGLAPVKRPEATKPISD
jgi:hypothetical protein